MGDPHTRTSGPPCTPPTPTPLSPGVCMVPYLPPSLPGLLTMEWPRGVCKTGVEGRAGVAAKGIFRGVAKTKLVVAAR